MAKLDLPAIWRDVKTYRRAYLLTAIASFGGMLFGWDTGLIGVLPTSPPPYSPPLTLTRAS